MDEKLQQIWDRQEKLEERIRMVENQQAGTIIYIKEIKEDLKEIKEDIKKIKPSDIKSTSFWTSDQGKFVVRTLCVIGVLLVMAAIGMNYFKEYLQAVIK